MPRLNFFEIKSRTLIIALPLYFTAILNLSFLRQVYTNIDFFTKSGMIIGVCYTATLFLALLFLFAVFLLPYLTKPLGVILLLLSSVANYMMFQYGIYINPEMIRNVFETTPRESLDYLNVSIVLWVVITGILPALYLIKTRVVYQTLWGELKTRGLFIVLSLLAIAGMAAPIAPTYKELSLFGRNHKDIVRLINPTNYIYGTARFFQRKAEARQTFTIIDPNSQLTPYPDTVPTVFVMMVGETARAMNFSLNGYARKTNPELEKEDLVNFTDVSAAGTYTAFSVPSIFSHLPRKDFDIHKAPYTENLVDIIQKAGYNVQWLDNDEGCKEVCKRVPTVYMTDLKNTKYCVEDYCYDGVLIEPLEEILKNVKSDTFIVLHMMGSHGPSYYKRYPSAFARFKPTCDTSEAQNCDKESLVNTYDNTILYTDYIIAQAIKALKKYPSYEAGLLYVSDHGESLGENNIYLHGLPYAIAPKEQIKVPMLLWMSATMKKEDYIDYDCLKKKANAPISHDNLFHSLIALMEIYTKHYDPDLDLFATCRQRPLPRPKK